MSFTNLQLKNWGTNLLDFLFPRVCVHCGAGLTEDEKFLCAGCASKLSGTDEQILHFEFEKKFSSDGFISDFYAPLFFIKDTPIQSLIHELKYKNKFGVGKFLGELIVRFGKEKLQSWPADFIVPIPLHNVKKAMRGYNQSYYLAKGVAENSNLQLKRLLKRKKFTTSQTTLTKVERKHNVYGAFTIKRFIEFEGKKIILIDDVITTGSTIAEAARMLKENGAAEIYALSACLAQ